MTDHHRAKSNTLDHFSPVQCNPSIISTVRFQWFKLSFIDIFPKESSYRTYTERPQSPKSPSLTFD